MDKNMIHIDELVKQRLGGGEEREIPGSWARMRELLDKEMPEKKRVAGYYNWRRMFGTVTGLLLLSVLTVGSYNLVNSYRLNTANSEKVISAANTMTSMSGNVNDLNKAQHRSIVSAKTQKAPIRSGKSSVRTHINNITSYAANKPDLEIDKHSGDAEIVPPPISQKKLVITSSDNKLTNKASQKGKFNKVAAGKKASVQDAEFTDKEKGTVVAHEKSDNLLTTTAGPSKEINNKQSLLHSEENNNAVGNEKHPVQSSDNFSSAATADNTRLKLTPAPIQPDLPKDTLKKMQVIQRMAINPLTQMSRIMIDTVSIERLAVNRNANINPTVAASNGSLSIAASVANAEVTANETLVPLSNFKIQSRKTSKWNARSFDEVVQDVKFNLAQTKFYPGISAGGNSYMFGYNNLSGFQLGLFGLFTFGEAWGAMGELKYIQRFNSGATLSDNYIDVVQKQGSYLQGNVEHFFKFTSLQSIEMPLALRYAAGRLNLFGGLNLAYHFAVNVDEQTLTSPDTAYKAFNNPGGKIKVRPSVSYDDFRARFALGGLLGISYELLPSLQLDFRATKNVWDNGYGLGAEQVSSQLYNAPSIQFSIFYRFSQRNQIPKAK